MLNYSPSSLSFAIDWRIKREPIYRIFDKTEWMDNFFENGEIMLSCFNNFKKYEDEMQGDKDEGKATIGGEDENGNDNFVIYESGINAYIMSTTMELNDPVIKDFKGKCAIKINHPSMFSLEIYKKLPFVIGGLEGICDYIDSRIEIYEKASQENQKFQKIDFKNDLAVHRKIQEITLERELFLKLKKYSHQKEYRLIWFSNKKVEKSAIIKCPEAVEYCQKIYF